MNKRWKIFVLLLALLLIRVDCAFAQDFITDKFQYLCPIPGSKDHNPETEITIRFGEKIEKETVKDALLQVDGDKSGNHPGNLSLSPDHFTLSFIPENIFLSNEKVTLYLKRGIKTITGKQLPEIQYWFTVKNETDSFQKHDKYENFEINSCSLKKSTDQLYFGNFLIPIVSLSKQPLTANILTTLVNGTLNYLYVFNNDAIPVFVKLFDRPISNLKPQSSELLTYYDRAVRGFVALDKLLNAVDTFSMVNGYLADSHDIILLNDGHSILFAYDPKIVDMSKIVEGGNPSTTVSGLVIQELDKDKNLVFQWRSWDYFKITDSYSDLLVSVIDYVHGNSLDADTDTTLIISSRNLSEVTKIDRLTGKIIWRLGGKNNEFSFQSGSKGFSGQHSALRQNNGNLTLYDNGIGLAQSFSRGVDYQVDEANKIVKQIHEYRHSPDVYANVSGNLQRLTNGNTLIFWGPPVDNSEKYISEFDNAGNLTYECKFAFDYYPTYRAYKSTWEPKLFTFNKDTIHFKQILQNQLASSTFEITNNSTKKITITSCVNNNRGFSIQNLPLSINAGEKENLAITFTKNSSGHFADNLIICQETDSTIVTRSIYVDADVVTGTDVNDKVQSDLRIYPNPSDGLFHIDLNKNKRYLLKVLDIYGNSIWYKKNVSLNTEIIDIKEKPDGLYFLYIIDDVDDVIKVEKLVKQNGAKY